MLVAMIAASVVACSSSGGDAKADASAPRARFLVALADPPADLAEYRALADQSDEAAAYAEKKRQALRSAHAALEAQVKALGGDIVAVWWMTSAFTVEIEASKASTLTEKQKDGAEAVKSVTPDVIFGEEHGAGGVSGP